jgi:tetratricopeptide (TPR) repeat protein
MANFRWIAEKMRQLDSSSAQYHTAIALIKYNEWKWDEEIAHLKLALRANPNFTRAHGLYGGVLLRARGDPKAALREFEAAERCEGFDAIIQMHLGTPYYVMGDYTNAIAQFKRAVSLGTAGGSIWERMGYAYEANGRYQEALDCYEKDEQSQPNAHTAQIAAEYHRQRQTLSRKGARGLWEARLENLQRWWPDPYALGSLQARLGNTNQALALLDKAFQQHHQAMTELLVDHYWRPLYGDPGFQQLVSKMGFTPKQ